VRTEPADDCRTLWEHLVLEKLFADAGEVPVLYWRDKQRHEVDFVLPRGRGELDAIERKWEADGCEPKDLRVFRARHPVGKNTVVSANVTEPFTRHVTGMKVQFTGLQRLSV
jgi:predicted AAA+ superfamily ATPase